MRSPWAGSPAGFPAGLPARCVRSATADPGARPVGVVTVGAVAGVGDHEPDERGTADVGGERLRRVLPRHDAAVGHLGGVGPDLEGDRADPARPLLVIDAHVGDQARAPARGEVQDGAWGVHAQPLGVRHAADRDGAAVAGVALPVRHVDLDRPPAVLGLQPPRVAEVPGDQRRGRRNDQPDRRGEGVLPLARPVAAGHRQLVHAGGEIARWGDRPVGSQGLAGQQDRVPLTAARMVSRYVPVERTVTPLTRTQLAGPLPMNPTFCPPEQPPQELTRAPPDSVFPGASASYDAPSCAVGPATRRSARETGSRPWLVSEPSTWTGLPGTMYWPAAPCAGLTAFASKLVAGGWMPQFGSVLTRNMTVPCAGTCAAMSPADSAVAPILAPNEFSLNSATATSPPASGLANTHRPSWLDSTRPWMPSRSWSTAMTSRLSRMSYVAGVTLRRSAPISNGAAMMAQRLKCDRYSVSVIPPLPTSSMSGSFQWPRPANSASAALRFMMVSIELKLSLMSPVVRHRCPTSAAHCQGMFCPHSQML